MRDLRFDMLNMKLKEKPLYFERTTDLKITKASYNRAF
jgi:hypothetical protein